MTLCCKLLCFAAASKIHAQQARAELGDMVVDWKERPTDQGLRCYALIKRQQVSDFQQRMQATKLASPKPAIVSGPWPATEFLHD